MSEIARVFRFDGALMTGGGGIALICGYGQYAELPLFTGIGLLVVAALIDICQL